MILNKVWTDGRAFNRMDSPGENLNPEKADCTQRQ